MFWNGLYWVWILCSPQGIILNSVWNFSQDTVPVLKGKDLFLLFLILIEQSDNTMGCFWFISLSSYACPLLMALFMLCTTGPYCVLSLRHCYCIVTKTVLLVFLKKTIWGVFTPKSLKKWFPPVCTPIFYVIVCFVYVENTSILFWNRLNSTVVGSLLRLKFYLFFFFFEKTIFWPGVDTLRSLPLSF